MPESEGIINHEFEAQFALDSLSWAQTYRYAKMGEVFGLSHIAFRRPSREIANNPGSYLPPGQLRNDFTARARTRIFARSRPRPSCRRYGRTG